MGRAANFSGLAHRSHLVNFKGSISNSVLCLLMTGRATQFLHNGVQYRGDEDHAVITKLNLLTTITIVELFYYLSAVYSGNGIIDSFTAWPALMDGQRGKDTSN